jgi:membrane-associated phospholipid phosphatase
LFIVIAFCILIQINVGDELIEISKHNNAFLDALMPNWTMLSEAYIYVVLFLVCLLYRFGHSFLFLSIGAAVSICSFLSKIYFSNPRPYSYFSRLGIESKLHIVEMNDINIGNSSFPSGHTMSAFAIFGLLALLSKNKNRNAILLFFMAVSVGYSRMYLSQHFLRDITSGALIGTFFAILYYHIFTIEKNKNKKWCNRQYFSNKTYPILNTFFQKL